MEDGAVIHVLHIIIDLNVGGAELMLKRLVESYRDNPNFQHTVISLTDTGDIGRHLESLGVKVKAMGMSSLFDIPRVLWQLTRLIRVETADIVQTWMYHSDLLGGLAAWAAGKPHVIWGIRGSTIPQPGLSKTGLVVVLCSWLSHFLPRVIVCCAKSARDAHVDKGYDQRKMVVIPNGYEFSYFTRDPLRRHQLRSIFGFHDNDIVIGIVGRFDPLKDYKNFVRAAAIVATKVNYVKFLMVGRGIDTENCMLKGWLDESGFANKFVLTGERSDIPICMSAMDIFCLSSSNEGFPNVVCEAMAMNIPCVVTNVGDACDIVSNTGIVVAPNDSIALAEGLQTMIGKGIVERSRLGVLARRRVEDYYSIATVSSRFENLYNRLVSDNRQCHLTSGE